MDSYIWYSLIIFILLPFLFGLLVLRSEKKTWQTSHYIILNHFCSKWIECLAKVYGNLAKFVFIFMLFLLHLLLWVDRLAIFSFVLSTHRFFRHSCILLHVYSIYNRFIAISLFLSLCLAFSNSTSILLDFYLWRSGCYVKSTKSNWHVKEDGKATGYVWKEQLYCSIHAIRERVEPSIRHQSIW